LRRDGLEPARETRQDERVLLEAGDYRRIAYCSSGESRKRSFDDGVRVT
jgi:hypothetical protein